MPWIQGAFYGTRNLSNDVLKKIKGEPFGTKKGLLGVEESSIC